MRILKITEYAIEFDNGKDISFEHYQECCEINYADFEQLDSLARDDLVAATKRLREQLKHFQYEFTKAQSQEQT